MSGFTTGLTSIRKSSAEDSSTPARILQEEAIRNPSPETDKALAIKIEIDRLIKSRDELIREIGGLNKQGNPEIRRIVREISILKKQRDKLVDLVRNASKILFILNEAKGRGKISFDKFFEGREDILVKFASLVSSKLDNRAKLMNVRAEDVQKDAGLAEEMAIYSENLLEVAYNRLHEVDEAKKRTDSEVKRLLALKSPTERAFKKASETLNLAKSKLSSAVGVETNARELLRTAKAEVKRVTAIANKKAKIVDLKALKVLEKEKYFKTWEKNLSKTELRLKDKEETLKRNAERIRLAAAKVGLSGII